MTAVQEAIRRICAAGVTLSVVDGKLRYSAPPGWLTEDRRHWLSQHKAALIAELAPKLGDPGFDLASATCTVCGDGDLWTFNADGAGYCEKHAPPAERIESLLEERGWVRIRATRITDQPEIMLTAADTAVPERYRDLPRLSLGELERLYGQEPFPSLEHMRLILLAKQLCPGAHVEQRTRP